MSRQKSKKCDDSPNSFTCTEPKCKKSFATKTGLTQHLTAHKSPEVYCTLCPEPKPFQRRAALVTHRKVIHSVAPYLCAIDNCTEAYESSDLLDRHRRAEHTTCPGCGGTFLSAQGLKLHRQKCKEHMDFDSGSSGYASSEASSIVGGKSSMFSMDMDVDAGNQESGFAEEDSHHRSSPAEEPWVVICSNAKEMQEFQRNASVTLATASFAIAYFYTFRPAGLDHLVSENIDEILENGALQYSACRVRKRVHDLKLTPEDVAGTIFCSKPPIKAKLSFPDCHNYEGQVERSNLRTTLENFSLYYQFGVIVVSDECMAMFLEQGNLFLLDPNARSGSRNLDKGNKGKALFIKFKLIIDCDSVCDYLCERFSTSSTLPAKKRAKKPLEFLILPVVVT